MAYSPSEIDSDWAHILEEAILSGNIQNLRDSFDEFKLGENFINTDHEFEMHLSKIYEELKIKNVPVSEDIENFIVYNIIDFRFFTEKDSETQQELTVSLQDAKERIERVIKSMDCLLGRFCKQILQSDFSVLEIRNVLKDLNILKHLLRSTYNKLPWEEFEFCLAVYLMIIVEQSEADDVFKLVLDTERLITHMTTFRDGLEKLKSALNIKDINQKLRLARRGEFIQSVINFDDNFKSLYDDYDLIKDISSLRRIDSYIRVCMDLDFNQTESLDKLIIERTLQVIGECLKDTPDSPNISQEVQEILKRSAPSNLKEIITSLRDSLSHTEAFRQKVKMENERSTNFFQDIQNDLTKIHFEIINTLFRRKLAAVGVFAKKVLQCSCITQVWTLAELGKIDETNTDYENITVKQLEKVLDLVKQLEGTLETQPEMGLLRQAKEDLISQLGKINMSHQSYLAALYVLNNCIAVTDSHHDNLKFIKSLFRLAQDLIADALEAKFFENITSIIWKIKSSINQKSNKIVDEVNLIISEILNISTMKSGRINDIGRLQITLGKKEKEESEALRRCREIVELMMENVMKCLVPELQQRVRKAFQAKKDIYEAKSELILIINSKKANEETNPIIGERCKQLAKSLNMKKNNEMNFLSNFVSGDINICKSLVSIIDDPYGLLLNCINEFNSFSYKKRVKAFGNFLNSLKLKNLPTETIIKNFADENLKQIKHFYSSRLNLLKTTLFGDNSKDQWGAMKEFRSNKKIQVATELILLDMLNVLEDSSFLFDNKLYLDDYAPIPLGKALRNYLAHGNFIIDVLPFDVPLTIVSNAIKLINEGENLIEKENILIGKKLPNEIFKVVNVQGQMKFSMINQHMMYEAARSNNLVAIFLLTCRGAKLQSRSINGWTGLHYAASTDSLEAFKFFVKNFPNLTLQHELLSHVLHVAISYQSTSVLDYCISKFKVDLNELVYFAASCACEVVVVSLMNRTGVALGNAFCIAAARGHKNIVELLLKKEMNNMENLFTKGLNYASKNGSRKVVEILLSNNFDPNAAVDDYASPLYLATRNGHADIVDILLKGGAKMNQIFEDETVNLNDTFVNYFFHIKRTISRAIICEADMIPLLHLACIFGHRDILETLLNKSLEINQTTNRIFTPLHIAVACDQIDTIQLLIEKGADVNSLPENILSPLHLAAKNGRCDIIDLLLKNDAKIDIKGKDEYTPLHVASLYGHNEAVQLLISKGSDVNSETVTGETALGFACKTGDAHIVEDILNAGSEIDSPDQNGNTPLHTASFSGHPNIVTLLLNRNANVESVNKDKITPLHFASGRGFTNIVNILLQSRADVNKCDANGNTALMFAMECSHCDIIGCLLSNEANVNVCNADGMTPLHLASQNGLTEIVNTLIAKGAKCSPRTRDKICPLDLAISYGYKDVVCSLLLAGAEVDVDSTDGVSPLCLACKHGHTGIVNVLLRNGASVNRTDDMDISPLHYACENGYTEIVDILLDAGADITARDQGGATPLHIASLKGNSDVVRILLENGSDKFINSPNSAGETPLFLAAKSGSDKSVNVLLEKEARMHFVDSAEYTVLHNAANSGKEDV